MKNENILTTEQFAIYEGIVNEIEKYRGLSPEEKEALILDIVSRPYIDLLCDWAFKHVFGHHPELLILLLNDILPENITRLIYLPNESDRWKGDDKSVIMDVLCETAEGKKIIVEMQQQDRAWLKNRMMYYGASMLAGQLSAGDSYRSLKAVYVVCLMDFKLKHHDDRLIYAYQMRERESHELYGELLSIYLCELPRLASKPGKSLTPVEVWFDILQNMRNFASKPEIYGSKYDPIFESSLQSPIPDKDKLQYFRSMFDDDIRSYLTDEDRQEIAEEFFAKGVEAEKTKMAKALKDLGVSDDKIALVSGLSPEEISAL